MDLEASFPQCLFISYFFSFLGRVLLFALFSYLLVYILIFIHVVVPARLHVSVLAFQSFLKIVLFVSELGLEIVTKSNSRLTLLFVLFDIKERSNY